MVRAPMKGQQKTQLAGPSRSYSAATLGVAEPASIAQKEPLLSSSADPAFSTGFGPAPRSITAGEVRTFVITAAWRVVEDVVFQRRAPGPKPVGQCPSASL